MGLHSTVPDVLSGAMKVVHAVCSHDCPDSCGVLVTVDELTGRAVKMQGDPVASGDARIFVRQGGEVSGPGLFAGQTAVSDAAQGGRAEGATGAWDTRPRRLNGSHGMRRWMRLPRG